MNDLLDIIYKRIVLFYRIVLTLVITLIYSGIWMLLEKVIDGEVVNRTVDNIIMLLFIPIIFLATKTFKKLN